MRLSFITDEATQSFDEAVSFAKAEGLSGLELRSVEGLPIDAVPPGTLRQWRRVLDGEGLSVPSLAGSFCKCHPDDRSKERDKLERLLEAADILGAGLIRGFAFFAPEKGRLSPEICAGYLSEFEGQLRSGKKRLALEADPSVNTTNHRSLAAVLRLLDPELFTAVYDPGNDLYDPLRERPFPEGYEAVRPYLSHVHVKDAVLDAGGPRCVAPGTGLVGWPEVLRALRDHGYQGWLSLETHYRKGTALTEEQMRLPSGAEFTNGGMEATRESAAALRALLSQIGDDRHESDQ